MPLDKQILKGVLKLVGVSVGIIVLFGMVLPALISSKSTDLVVLGFVIIVTFLIYVLYNTFKK